ncbi:MAG: hypothetical protein JWM53_2514 [bacterium]|nr:hypothetical protein [bacterium]
MAVHTHYGESLIAMTVALGIPRNGDWDDGVTFVVFPGCCKDWPRSNAHEPFSRVALPTKTSGSVFVSTQKHRLPSGPG